MAWERMLLIVPEHNTGFKKDADEFKRQAAAFQRYHEARSKVSKCETVVINNKDPLQEAHVIAAIEDYDGPITTIAFFCHGYKNRLQFGFKGATGARKLADAIAVKQPKRGVQRSIFYACSTGKDEDNWFNWLSDQLERHGVAYWALAHETAGHTTRNPYVEYRGRTGSYTGAARLVRNGSPIWRRWREAMQGDLQYLFPYLTPREVTDLLGGMGEP